MKTISIHPPAHQASEYPVLIGKDLLKQIPALIKDADRVAIVHDARMKELALSVSQNLKEATLISVASGEASKTMSEAQRLCGEFLKAGLSRKSAVIAVGGGMLTDIAGFAASVYQRGIKVIHIPTTLLAMVDAAVGGKTAVDLGHAKNMIGTIHQPAAIVMDIATLASLPKTALAEGLVESVKMAAILDDDAFVWMEKNLPAILKRDEGVGARHALPLLECIARSVEMKAAVIEEDERETGKRMLLNFGHTVGHAVEALSHFAIPHGQAVSIGMACEMRMAQMPEAGRVLTLLNMMEMPTEIPAEQKTDALWELMTKDKKNSDGFVRMAVPDAIGHGSVKTITKDLFSRCRS
ncbi:MAG: 3-dehydroquinate synthase [Candidatus Peribacteraceae bacterium]|nr:3-dehydroquinate synthase [Candidatus Peribacteraceae bacterium]